MEGDDPYRFFDENEQEEEPDTLSPESKDNDRLSNLLCLRATLTSRGIIPT